MALRLRLRARLPMPAVMREISWVVGILLLAFAWTATGALPSLELIRAGERLMLGAAWLGIPLQIVYFATLGLALRLVPSPTPPGWFWAPFRHHDLLTAPQRWAVLPFFYSGALAFLAIVLGVAIVVVGMLAGLRVDG